MPGRVDEYEIIADGVTTGAGQRGLPQGGTASTGRDQLEVIRRAQSRLGGQPLPRRHQPAHADQVDRHLCSVCRRGCSLPQP